MQIAKLNGIAGMVISLFLVMLSCRFTAAYSSYAFIIFAIFFIGDAAFSYKKRCRFFTKGYEAIRLYGFGDLSSLFSVYLISSTT